MHIERFVVSRLRANTYVISEGAEAVIVDPGDGDLTPLVSYLEGQQLTPSAIWCTHGHFDHILGVDVLRSRYHIPAYVHGDDVELWSTTQERTIRWLGETSEPLNPPDIIWREGHQVAIKGLTFTVWHTPGHSAGGVCLIGDEVVFTGDTLFAGVIGRVDLPESDPEAMRRSLERLLHLPDSITLLPGHGRQSTMGQERTHNPYLHEL